MQLVELAPEDLRSAALTAQWEDRLARIAKGQERDAKFVEEMRAYASRLVAAVKARDAKYTHANQTRKTCPDCGKKIYLFGEGKTAQAAAAHSLPLLAEMPIDPALASLTDAGSIEDFQGDWPGV